MKKYYTQEYLSKRSITLFLIVIHLFVLNACGQSSKEKKSQTSKSIIGETFSLTDTLSKHFLYKPFNVKNVYSYDINGHVIKYINNVDYVVNYKDGTIRRTMKSNIPNYAKHQVIYSSVGEGKYFYFSPKPRNPELNIDYQIIVDYDYSIIDVKHMTITSQMSKFISPQNKFRLCNKRAYKIIALGTSITNSAHTTSSYYFNDKMSSAYWGFLSDALKKYYNSDSIVVNHYSSDGAWGADIDEGSIKAVLDQKPNCVIVEYGMNDHNINAAPASVFEYRIESLIQRFKKEGIDVIVVGFFQQNQQWEAESTTRTIEFNAILQKLAYQNFCYFADIMEIFNCLYPKNLYEDITADYMHHPTDFGHRIYFSTILPVFLNTDVSVFLFDNYIPIPH